MWHSDSLTTNYTQNAIDIKYTNTGEVHLVFKGFKNLTNQTYNEIGSLPSGVPIPSIQIQELFMDGGGHKHVIILKTDGKIIDYPYDGTAGQENIYGTMSYVR